MKKLLVASFMLACLMSVCTLGAKASHILAEDSVHHIDVNRTSHNIEIAMSDVDVTKPIFISLYDGRGSRNESLEVTRIEQYGDFTEVLNGRDIVTHCWWAEYKNVFSANVDHKTMVNVGPLRIEQIPVLNASNRLNPLGTKLRVTWTCYAGFCREQNARVQVYQPDGSWIS